jgi:nitrite reductase/ring-hydroxylating ferredoxin subunit
MNKMLRSRLSRCLTAGLALTAIPIGLASAQEKAIVPNGGTVHVTVTTATAPPPPPVSITLYERHGHVTALKGKCTHTGGGLIDVSSPSPDTIVITMSGAVVANAEMKFDLDQCFEVSLDDPKVKKAKVTVEGRVIGLLRGEKKGSSDYSDACAHVSCGPVNLLSVCVPPHSVCGCENLAVNDHDGPKTLPIAAGKYTLNQTFVVSAHTDSYVCKRPSAEFAPDPAIDPLWINYHEPFHGVKKDTFGFQVTLKVAPDTDDTPGDKKTAALTK